MHIPSLACSPACLSVCVARACVLLAACALLAACGHRGALYMPGKPGDPAYDREHKGEVPGKAAPKPIIPPAEDKAVGSDKTPS